MYRNFLNDCTPYVATNKPSCVYRLLMQAEQRGISQLPPSQLQSANSVRVIGKGYPRELTIDEQTSVELWMRGQFATYRQLRDSYDKYLLEHTRYAFHAIEALWRVWNMYQPHMNMCTSDT
jgi:hypothetical protein